MTTEDDFQDVLDRTRWDHQTRLVLADFLEERGDPRAEGYRALGTLRRIAVPWHRDSSEFVYWASADRVELEPAVIPMDWWKTWSTMVREEDDKPFEELYPYRCATRRVAEDLMALAFRRQGDLRRKQILELVPPFSIAVQRHNPIWHKYCPR